MTTDGMAADGVAAGVGCVGRRRTAVAARRRTAWRRASAASDGCCGPAVGCGGRLRRPAASTKMLRDGLAGLERRLRSC